MNKTLIRLAEKKMIIGIIGIVYTDCIRLYKWLKKDGLENQLSNFWPQHGLQP